MRKLFALAALAGLGISTIGCGEPVAAPVITPSNPPAVAPGDPTTPPADTPAETTPPADTPAEKPATP